MSAMRLIFVSGLSGAGKSVALNVLEDLGFYCIDNMPAAMLNPLVSHAVRNKGRDYERMAIGIDARNTAAEIGSVPALISDLKRSGIRCEIVYLLAQEDELVRRFAETKRKHPLGSTRVALREAIAIERGLLEPIINAADLVIDTSRISVHALREIIISKLEQRAVGRLSITFESFGFKHGLPGDADFVFDARTLPNPYWDPALRQLTGRDPEVIRYLESQPAVQRLLDDIAAFIEARIPEHQTANRLFMTVAVGCTGGQHRSVYLVERLVERFADRHPHVSARHNSLSR